MRVSIGELFTADGLIIAGDNLQADESSLTREAYPVAKRPLTTLPAPTPDSEDAFWIDGDHRGFAGTRLLTGEVEMRVVFTGGHTLYGEIVRAAMRTDRERTPLQSAIANLVTLLIVSAGVLCLILAVIRLRQGHGWIDAMVSAATLAVAALPEEFPVVFTVFLGIGVYRLARQKALVRRSVSVENIVRVTCVCADKTGTITEGRLRLEHRVPAEEYLRERSALLGLSGVPPGNRRPMDTASVILGLSVRPGWGRKRCWPSIRTRNSAGAKRPWCEPKDGSSR